MKLTLVGCLHRKVLWSDRDAESATCESCYQRLRTMQDESAYRGFTWTRDYPPGVCDHKDLVPVQENVTTRHGYRDAWCRWCGRMLRHPDGVGSWQDAIPYHYVIHETPNFTAGDDA